jgi:hypothetical protein
MKLLLADMQLNEGFLEQSLYILKLFLLKSNKSIFIIITFR